MKLDFLYLKVKFNCNIFPWSTRVKTIFYILPFFGEGILQNCLFKLNISGPFFPLSLWWWSLTQIVFFLREKATNQTVILFLSLKVIIEQKGTKPWRRYETLTGFFSRVVCWVIIFLGREHSNVSCQLINLKNTRTKYVLPQFNYYLEFNVKTWFTGNFLEHAKFPPGVGSYVICVFFVTDLQKAVLSGKVLCGHLDSTQN